LTVEQVGSADPLLTPAREPVALAPVPKPAGRAAAGAAPAGAAPGGGAPAPSVPTDALKQRIAAEIAARDSQWRTAMQQLQDAYAADVASREAGFAEQRRTFEASLDELQALLTAASRGRDDEAQDRAAAETELQARRAQLAAQHLELESRQDEVTKLAARVSELWESLEAERQNSARWMDRAQRLEATLREFAGRAHDATAEAAAMIADEREAAVRRGDEIAEQVGYHEAAVVQLRSTIETQRAAYERVLEERQAALARCVELESQLHALTRDARHLAEGLQRVQAERDADRVQRPIEPVAEVAPTPRLRLATSSETA
jgi:chromosome segregation ATPase